eukprot:jgi/Picsp_1/6175/NSC_03529-R1_ndp-hexose -dehydratase
MESKSSNEPFYPASVIKNVFYAPNAFEAYGDAEIQAVVECLREGWLAGNGKYSCEFETKIASIFQKKYALFVNSGSSANLLALECLDLPKGSKVVTPACTFATTVSPILQLGLVPEFIDVELNAYVPSVSEIMSRVYEDENHEISAIMIPNLVGNLPDWKGLRDALVSSGRSNDIVIIEDSADTIPCYTSSELAASDISTTSFYASHTITAAGSGGMVMFNNPVHLRRARMYRDWGRIGSDEEDFDLRFREAIDNIPYDGKFLYGVLGYNFKSCEMNAAFGLAQLTRLDEILRLRRSLFEEYLTRLRNVPGLILPEESIVVSQVNWLAFPLQVQRDSEGKNRRTGLLRYLESKGIQTRVLFSGNITRHPAYTTFKQAFKNADQIMSDGFLLGCHHGMNKDDVALVCHEIISYVTPLA